MTTRRLIDDIRDRIPNAIFFIIAVVVGSAIGLAVTIAWFLVSFK